MPTQPPEVSIVVPVHNEAAFIPVGLPRLIEAAHSVYPGAEILIMENGSTDGTAAAARLAAGDSVQIHELPTPDYGGAMREGILVATGDWVVTFDIDYFSAQFLEDLSSLTSSADVVIASKRDPRSEDRRSAFRRFATFGFNLLLRTILGSRVSDTHGIKAFRAAAARLHALDVVSRKDLYDTELVVRMERAGARITEVPVIVEELRPARSSLLKRVPRTIKGLLAIRRALRS
ncbi:MAG: glycosyltransferase family 2 protein [Acidimicrobiia bacterium]